MSIQPVKPGDLIKAEQWNALLERLKLMEERIVILENRDEQVEILDLQFKEPLRVGEALRILGRNFRTAQRAARVFIDGHEALPDPDTFTSSLMDVFVPDEVEPPAAGKQVLLLVSNVLSEAQRRLTVLPREVILTGPVDVQWVGVQPAKITPRGEIYWEYTARSRASRKADFTLAARVEPSGLINAAQFEVLKADKETPLKLLTLDPRESIPTRFFLRLDPFPNLPTGTRFSLAVRLLVGGQSYTSSNPEAFTVAQETQQPDDTIQLSISVTDPENAWVQPNIIKMPAGVAQVQLQLLADFSATPPYQRTVYLLIPGEAPGWTVNGDENAAEYPVTVDQWEQAEQEGEAHIRQTLNYFISPDAGAAERTLTITLEKRGETRKQDLAIILRP